MSKIIDFKSASKARSKAGSKSDTRPKTTSQPSTVIDIFTRKPLSESLNNKLIRIAPELDGLEMLYCNSENQDKLFSIKVLAWGLRSSGEVIGLVPWLDELVPCDEINDPLNGAWQGYYDAGVDELFYNAPLHKIVELETAADYYEYQCESDREIIQEIPDTIGTHAVLSADRFKSITLKEVVSWRLYQDGVVSAMLIDDSKMLSTPVLPGDDCLFGTDECDDFCYFFQHHIANKIKAQDPEALAAISTLSEN
jgi:hypothetical protein|tara:strand:- start:3674 stop:4432 length:759 start_codon:yes stop_codon:yes gene_type:complete